MGSGMRFDVAFKGQLSKARKEASDPFRILVIGDFGSPHPRGERAPIADGPREVSTETLDAIIAKLAPEVRLEFVGTSDPTLTIRFASLEDFHPDRLLEHVAPLRTLCDLRDGLKAPATFEASAAIVRAWTQPSASVAPPPATPAPDEPAPVSKKSESEDALLERLMGRPRSPQATTPPPKARAAQIDGLIKQMVGASTVAPPPADQQTLMAAVDTEISRRLRAILHHPDFRALEAAWRGLDFLTRTLELDENLKLFMLNASRADLQDDLLASDDLSRTRLYDLLVRQTVESPGGEPWDVIAGLYEFQPISEDAELLGRLAAIGRGTGAPFLAAADYDAFRTLPASAVGGQAWDILRKLPIATWAGLATPRFLLRLPYGKGTDAIDHFAFTEAATPPQREDYLWGNPALVCVCLLGQSFSDAGWDFSPGDHLLLEGLPTHIYREDGESKMTPCAEVWMSETQATGLMNTGLMPCLSIRGRDAVRLGRFQSISQPLAALSGRWSE